MSKQHRIGILGAGRAVAGLLACAAGAGCVDSNDRESIGTEVVLNSLSDADSPTQEQVFTGGTNDPTSLTGLSRANWNMDPFLVPVDGVGHQPTYATDLRFTNVTARQRGEAPTIESSLELDGPKDSPAFNQRLAEVVLQPIWAFGQAILILPGLVVEPQTKIVTSPTGADQRVRPPEVGAAAAPEAGKEPEPAPPPPPSPTDPVPPPPPEPPR